MRTTPMRLVPEAVFSVSLALRWRVARRRIEKLSRSFSSSGSTKRYSGAAMLLCQFEATYSLPIGVQVLALSVSAHSIWKYIGPAVLLEAVNWSEICPVKPFVERFERIQQQPSVSVLTAAVFFHHPCAITATYCTPLVLP